MQQDAGRQDGQIVSERVESIRQANLAHTYTASAIREDWLNPDGGRFAEPMSRYFHPQGLFLEEGFAPPEMETTDFSIIRKDGIFHLFGVAGHKGSFPNWPGEYESIYHATTEDLINWRLHGNVLKPHPDRPWERHKIWPPFVFAAEGRYAMIYCGLDGDNCQTLGIAESDDLFHWQRSSDRPIVDPGTLSWALHRPDGKVRHCRDPHVIRCGEDYLLYYAIVCADGNTGVGLAVSRDLRHWEDAGPCLKSDHAKWIMESPLVMERAGQYLLWALPFNRCFVSDTPYHFHSGSVVPVESPVPVIAPEIVDASLHDRYLIGLYGPRGRRITFAVLHWPQERGGALRVEPIVDVRQLAPWGIG